MSRSRSTTESTTEVEAPAQAVPVKTRVRKTLADHAAAEVYAQLDRIAKQKKKIDEAGEAYTAAQALLPTLTARLTYLAGNPDLDKSVYSELQDLGYEPVGEVL